MRCFRNMVKKLTKYCYKKEKEYAKCIKNMQNILHISRLTFSINIANINL